MKSDVGVISHITFAYKNPKIYIRYWVVTILLTPVSVNFITYFTAII